MRVLALTNMYPTEETPHYGIFVRNTIEAIRHADPAIAIDILFVDGRSGRLAYAAAPARVLARARGHDLLHVHYGLLAGAGAIFPGPRVLTLYGSDVNDPSQLRWARPFLGRYAGLAVMNEGMRERVGRPDAEILPPGIDLALFAPRDRAEARARLGLDPSARYVLFPSSPERRVKRFDLFAEVVARVAERRVDVRPLLLGRPLRADTEVPWVYAASDLLLLTSDSEGSPTVVKEALAMNLPVVSVDVGDVAALLGDAHPSRVVGSRDPAALAAAVLDVLDFLDAGSPVSGRERAERLSIDATARGYVALYRRVARKRTP